MVLEMLIVPLVVRSKREYAEDHANDIVCPFRLEKRIVAAIVKNDEQPYKKPTCDYDQRERDPI